MRRSDAVVAALCLTFGGFIAYAVLHTPHIEPMPAQSASSAAATTTTASEATAANETVVSSSLPAPQRNVADIRQRLLNSNGTFIGEILAARDSTIMRWIDRRSKPVSVWIDERSPLAGPDQQLASNVRRAFADWGQAGAPLAFTFIGNAGAAEIRVTFVDHFERGMSGVTLWTRDINGWILGGEIQLGLRSSSRQLLNNDQLYAIALHEVGHMLGLDHTKDTLAIMAPRVRALALTPADVSTLRLIYQVPPGSVKAAQ